MRNKIYKVTRTDPVGYDEYEWLLVVARNETEALQAKPHDENDKVCDWTNVLRDENAVRLQVEQLGFAMPGKTPGTVLASCFKAG